MISTSAIQLGLGNSPFRIYFNRRPEARKLFDLSQFTLELCDPPLQLPSFPPAYLIPNARDQEQEH